MKSCALAMRAAFSICARLAPGWPKAMLAATVLEKRKILLKDNSNGPPQLLNRNLPHIDSIHLHAACLGIVKAGNKAHEGAFARACSSCNGNDLSGVCGKTQIAQKPGGRRG